LVGPLSKARGGFEYLLTFIDLATSWPEAVALRKTTAKVIVDHCWTFLAGMVFRAPLFPTMAHSLWGKCLSPFVRIIALHTLEHLFTAPRAMGWLNVSIGL